MMRDELKEGEVLKDGAYPALCNQNYHPICLRWDCYEMDTRQTMDLEDCQEFKSRFSFIKIS